jgi:hypothetical protein
VPGKPDACWAETVHGGLDPQRPPSEPVPSPRCQSGVQPQHPRTRQPRPQRRWDLSAPVGWWRRLQGGGRTPPAAVACERRQRQSGPTAAAAQGAELAVLRVRGIGGSNLLGQRTGITRAAPRHQRSAHHSRHVATPRHAHRHPRAHTTARLADTSGVMSSSCSSHTCVSTPSARASSVSMRRFKITP